jgi:hypothetical protein|tara:strand:+ start:53231 stop:53701 length:471 start_codon:yes stop_codon:yes gene_type:complete
MNAEAKIVRGYEPRVFEYYGVHEARGVWIKLYSITRDGSETPKDVISASVSLGRKYIGSDPLDAPVGFVIAHVAREAVFYVVCWWNDENMLRTAVYRGSLEAPLVMESIADTNIVACVWELEIISFERDQWVDKVLKPKKLSLADYLNTHYESAND